MKLTVVLLASLALGLAASAQQTKDTPSLCPAHDMSAMQGLNERGEQGMGFSQTATTHHFLLTANGGVIQVEANDPADAASRDTIRMHLRNIAHAFQTGDFDIPMFVHDTVPPGVAVMKERIKQIRYSIEETPSGGRVVIQTGDKAALAAIHSFLRFQITEHKTGDPLNP
jgi:hypothetical protein